MKQWLRRAVELIEDRHAEAVTMRDVAASAGVHPVTLAREFRRYFGISPREHLRRARIRTAADLLMHSEAPICDIAFATGFADQSHFARTFRRMTGETPARFRAARAT